MIITIEPSIFEKTPQFILGYLEIANVIISESHPEFWINFEREINAVRGQFNKNDPYIQGMRRLYKAWRIDPLRYRPSAERLHRRILRGGELFRINTAVDVCNLISLRYRLPLGLYDKDRINGEIILRYGAQGEKYMGITGLEISAENKVVVCDESGPIGSATTDSRRTSVDAATTALIVLVYGPENAQENYIQEVMFDFTDTLSAQQKPPLMQVAAEIFNKQRNE